MSIRRATFPLLRAGLKPGYLPGAADLQPGQTEIYGVYDFRRVLCSPIPRHLRECVLTITLRMPMSWDGWCPD